MTFKPEKIEKPDDSKLIALVGLPVFRDGAMFMNSTTNHSREPEAHCLTTARCLEAHRRFRNVRWALRHPVVKDAITKALANRFPAR